MQQCLRDIVAYVGLLVRFKGLVQLRGHSSDATDRPILLYDSFTMVEESANPMASAVAMGKIAQHSVILEFELPSYRTNEADNRQTVRKQTGEND